MWCVDQGILRPATFGLCVCGVGRLTRLWYASVLACPPVVCAWCFMFRRACALSEWCHGHLRRAEQRNCSGCCVRQCHFPRCLRTACPARVLLGAAERRNFHAETAAGHRPHHGWSVVCAPARQHLLFGGNSGCIRHALPTQYQQHSPGRWPEATRLPPVTPSRKRACAFSRRLWTFAPRPC